MKDQTLLHCAVRQVCPWRHKFQLSHWCNRWNNYYFKTVNRNRAYYSVFFLVKCFTCKVSSTCSLKSEIFWIWECRRASSQKLGKTSAFTFSGKQFINLSVKTRQSIFFTSVRFRYNNTSSASQSKSAADSFHSSCRYFFHQRTLQNNNNNNNNE
jgi:hypothetical protein